MNKININVDMGEGFNIEEMESLGKTTGQAFQPVGSVTYNEASGTYSDILGNEFTADLNGKFTPVNTFKAGEINLQGDVTQIGGLDLKILGGIRAGVKTFIFPKSNQ